MPQLSIETFFSQYFWLVLILSIIYYLMVTEYIPSIAATIKARKISSTSVHTVTKGSNDAHKLLKEIASTSTAFNTKGKSVDHLSAFKKNFSTFFSKPL